MSISLSNRQYPMLKTFIDGGVHFHMSIDDAMAYDQRPFRSMLMRRWVRYRRDRGGFVITREGREAWDTFQTTGIFRKNRDLPLTAFFDPVAYRLPRVGKARKQAAA
jgi:hypothetical protein